MRVLIKISKLSTRLYFDVFYNKLKDQEIKYEDSWLENPFQGSVFNKFGSRGELIVRRSKILDSKKCHEINLTISRSKLFEI